MSTAPPTPRPAGPRPEARKLPWSRPLHRIGSLIAVLVMLWMSITGMSMQIIDLHAIWTHEPPTTPTALSMEEGMYGPADYAVIQTSDFTAPVLPAGFDFRQGVHTVLQAAHAQQNNDSVAAGGANGAGSSEHGGPAISSTHGHTADNGDDPAGSHPNAPQARHRPDDSEVRTPAGSDAARPHSHSSSGGPQDVVHGDGQPGTRGRSGERPDGMPAAAQAGGNVSGQPGVPQRGPAGRTRGGSGGAGGGQPAPMAWVELRMIHDAPAGQIMLGTRLVAFNALTGAAITPVSPLMIPQGGRLPPSLRQKLKTLHRFWNRHDTPGVYFEFLVGLVLLFLIFSGLVIYFQMLGVRFRQRNWQPLWTAGRWWRSLHRIVSVVAAVFLLLLALSGTWIGFESSAGPLRRALMSSGSGPGVAPPNGQTAPQAGAGPQAGGPGNPGGRGRRRNPIDFIIPLRDGEVEEMTDATLTAMNQLHPATPIKALRLRIYGQMKQGVVIRGGGETDQYVFNADTGEPASLTEQGYPGSFPFGTQVHENVKHFHSGAMFGVTGRVMNLLTGFSLAFLSISGLVMYFDMWLKRRRVGKGNFTWR